MGYAFNENHKELKLKGEVVYRKKNIRSQNRQLKMKFHGPKHTNKHIYFDDNGMEITNTIDKVNWFLNNINYEDIYRRNNTLFFFYSL